jgi:RNA polymerase-binding transcription factor
MDLARAQSLVSAERAELERRLGETVATGGDDRAAESESGGAADGAQPLAAEGVTDAIIARLHERLAALDRAQQRLDQGTYGLSVRSGVPIPDERLEADPAAELTIEEARVAR